jgi:hypothetical protein
VAVAIVASVAACGGGGGASTAPGASVAATPKPAASAAAPTEAAPSAAASTAAGGGGGGGAAGVACDLLSAAEASGVVGGGTYTTESLPGDPSYCTYKGGDGSIKVLTSFGQKDAKLGYDAWASASDSVKVAGIGDGAVWVPTLATLLILKGDKVFGVTAGTGQDDETQRIDWSKALGAFAAAKM